MSNSKTFNIISSTFNKIYADVNSIDIMPNYSKFNSEMMHYLRQALYYELYGDTYKLIVKDDELPKDKLPYKFADQLNYASDGDTDNRFIPIKMTLYAKNLMPHHDYDLSNEYTSDFQTGLSNMKSELNLHDKNIKTYVLDVLFSDYPFFIESGLTNYAMQNAKHTREIQQHVNKYITQKGHFQLAYGLGLIAPNGYDNQRVKLPLGLFQQKFVVSKLQRAVALIYQEVNGWTPMDLKMCSVINRLPMNPESKYWYDSIVFLSGSVSDKTDHPTQSNIRSAFTFGMPDLHNLSMDPVCHLTTSSDEVVQAFYLDNTNPNNYKIHAIQKHKAHPILSPTAEKQTVIRTGTFNPNEIDSTFHMPNCVLQDNIILTNHKPLISTNTDESTWPEAQRMNAHLVAHTQTLAPVGNDQFLIGIYGDNSEFEWAQALGLFDLSGRKAYNYYNDISKIPYITGFNSYRLEAATNVTKKWLIIQTIDKDNTATFYKYELKPILDKLRNPLSSNRVDINDFKPDDTFYMPKEVKISSYQGFADVYKPITYATELEGITLFNNTSAYQLCTYHWSDSDLVKQDNSNILMHISWSYFASSDELDN